MQQSIKNVRDTTSPTSVTMIQYQVSIKSRVIKPEANLKADQAQTNATGGLAASTIAGAAFNGACYG